MEVVAFVSCQVFSPLCASYEPELCAHWGLSLSLSAAFRPPRCILKVVLP